MVRMLSLFSKFLFFFQAEDGIRDGHVTGVQTCALPISARAWWRRRRGADVSPAVSRPLALAWGSVSLAGVAATVLLLGSVLTAPSMRWIHAEGPAVWMLRLLTLAQLLLGAAWTLRAAARRHRLGRWSCALVPPALLIGLAVSVVLISWALPSSAL